MSEKKFKLGAKASSFVDMSTGKKVLPGASVEFTKKEMKSAHFKNAVSGGHLVEYFGQDSEDDLLSEALFAKLSVAKKKEYILENFEEDEAEIEALKSDELNERYADLISED